MIKAKPLERGKRGDNSRVKAGPVAPGRLKSFVDRIEKLESDRADISSDVRDVYAEAKGVGYDVKTIRWLVQERKVDANDRAERDALRDVYAHCLGTAVNLVQVEGLSLRQAEAVTGVSKSSIQRALAVPAASQPVIEMTADDLGEYIPPASGAAETAKPEGEVSHDGPGDDGRTDGAPEGGVRREAEEHGTDRGDSEAPARVVSEAGPEVSQAAELQNLPPVAEPEPTKTLYQRITGAFAEPRKLPITDDMAAQAQDAALERLQSLKRQKGFAT